MMARHILSIRQVHPSSNIGFGLGALLVCAFALFMCATHSRRRQWRRWKSCYGIADQDPVIQLNPEDHFDPAACSGEGTLWKKNILMGGKCQLPDFSGVIMYDSAGNVVAPPTRALPALTWK